VHALVRDPDKPTARALADAGAVLVRGDLNDETSLRSAMRGIHSVFSVQTFLGPGGVVTEERQGKRVGDAAGRAGPGAAHRTHRPLIHLDRDHGGPWCHCQRHPRRPGAARSARLVAEERGVAAANSGEAKPTSGGGLHRAGW